MKLTETLCKNAKPAEKSRKLADGHGLYLEVTPNGEKYWRMKYRHLGKERRLAFGVILELAWLKQDLLEKKLAVNFGQAKPPLLRSKNKGAF